MITIYFSSTDNWTDEKECSTPLEAAKAIEYQLGYDALVDANSYAVDSFGTSRATIDGATFEELREALPTSSILSTISTRTQDIINTAMTSAKNKNVDDAVTTLSNLLKEGETQSDSVAVKKAILDVEALKPSGDWLADYYGQSAGGSVINSYRSGHVRTIKVND